MEYRSEEFVYDPVGNMIRHEDRLDRPAVHTFDGPTIEHDYDRLQRRTGSARGCSCWQWKRLSRSLRKVPPAEVGGAAAASSEADIPSLERLLPELGANAEAYHTEAMAIQKEIIDLLPRDDLPTDVFFDDLGTIREEAMIDILSKKFDLMDAVSKWADEADVLVAQLTEIIAEAKAHVK